MAREKIVLLPGYDGDGEATFRKLGKLLENKFEVVTVDYPYLNNLDKQYSLAELVEYVDKIVDNKKVVILGFSMGGFVASAYATKYPEKVKKLILASSSIEPLLDDRLKNILLVAKILLNNKWSAWMLTKIFVTANLRNFPLPNPGKNFRSEKGYAVFGSLAKVISEKFVFNFDGQKSAILFEDDRSFTAKVYKPILKNQDFEVKVFETGGHAEGKDYWNKVAGAIKL